MCRLFSNIPYFAYSDEGSLISSSIQEDYCKTHIYVALTFEADLNLKLFIDILKLLNIYQSIK